MISTVRQGIKTSRLSRFLYFVRDSSSEDLLKYDNQDILSVGEESCADKKDTPYICSDAFYEHAVSLMDEYGLPEAGSSNLPFQSL